jgi:hypothetical protein
MGPVAAKAIKPKKRCCKDRPRCKRCPVVLKRLEAQGLAVKTDGRYVVGGGVKKKQLKAARR